MRANIISLLIIAAVSVADLFWPESSGGSLYPVPKVKIIVPAKPGGTTDSAARALANAFEEETGVKAIVVNQTAGGGSVAVDSIVNARPDGGTFLLYHAMLHVSNQTGRIPYSADQLSPLMTLSRSSDVFATRADAPFSSLTEAIEISSKQELLISSQMGGTTQLKASAVELAAKNAGGNIRSVAIGSMSKRLAALLGDQVDIAIIDVKSARQYLNAGRLKPLAVISDKRDPSEPNWPTALEQGVKIDLAQVNTLYGPSGISPELREKLDEILKKTSQSPALVESLKKISQSLEYRPSSKASVFVEIEAQKVQEILRGENE